MCVNVRKYYSVLIKAIIKRAKNSGKLVFASSSDDSLCSNYCSRRMVDHFFPAGQFTSDEKCKIKKIYEKFKKDRDRLLDLCRSCSNLRAHRIVAVSIFFAVSISQVLNQMLIMMLRRSTE